MLQVTSKLEAKRYLETWHKKNPCPHKLYKWFPLEDFAIQLEQRIESPSSINQGDGSYLCGVASFFYNLAEINPLGYTKYALGLYEKGVGEIPGKLGDTIIIDTKRISRKNLGKSKAFQAPVNKDIPYLDWMTLAIFADWNHTLFPMGKQTKGNNWNVLNNTLPYEMVKWFKNLGYTIGVDLNSAYTTTQYVTEALTGDEAFIKKQKASIVAASNYWGREWKVIFFVDSAITTAAKQAKNANGDLHKEMDKRSPTGTHYITLESCINIHEHSQTMSFSFYDYGDIHKDIHFRLEDFCKHYFGYLAFKPPF
ncbi:hypothetical protein FKG94_25880 [Exilibacterium tricleocarpae]|uniref:Uncharacterized protein n=1 Tax=Exilibacterium tricleocarpae TaxID=2591008 RepID=A0A545SQJ2_9GAMM|nr:hypothetical protein [Exilibacterium tricleocarpae]TQV67227.1 hypothetical protein FKG94_25880 [Exilibacterium tricleocarpae]